MSQEEKLDHVPVLVHWIYTRDEWKRFVRWKKLQKSYFHYTIYFLTPKYQIVIPEVKITHERVSFGDTHHHFHSNEHRLKRIEIRDEGKLNIMEITYEWSKRKTPGTDAIHVPVPKGKLREAIGTQEKLMKKFN